MLPPDFKQYFWDCAFPKLTVDTHATFVTERILHYGNARAVRWLLNHVHRSVVVAVVQRSRRLDAKTRNFWILMGYDA